MSNDPVDKLLNQGPEADRANYNAGYGNTDPQTQAGKAGDISNAMLAAQRGANGMFGTDKSESTSTDRYSGDTPDYGNR